MEARDFSALRISLASPEQIRSWSYGEVTKPETINYRRLRPEMDGLFCERIFGPSRDWQCHCGKYKNIRYRGIICDKCGVEVTRSSVRRERMGHIELAAPVAHVWYTRRVPSYLGLLLDVSRRNLDRVLYFAQYVVTQVDEDARAKAITRIEKELQSKQAEDNNDLAEQISSLRKNRAEILAQFEVRREQIGQHFESELNRLSDEAVSEAQQAQTAVESLLGQAAPTDINLESASATVVKQGELISNDHISRIQTLLNDYLGSLQDEMKAMGDEEVEKLADDIDATTAEIDKSLAQLEDEFLAQVNTWTESAEKQIKELNDLHVLLFLSEARYRELKAKFGNVFQANMGAEAFYEILSNLNLPKLADDLWQEVRTSRSMQRRRKATKRLRVVESLRNSRDTVLDTDESKQENEPDGNHPQWMILTVLPVIPPDLRPMVQLDGGRFATSDLNDLYRRVINRNNRLKHLLDLGAPDVIVRNEKRMLQEAVDSLIDNSQRGKALSRRGRRELKSLSDMLKGKKGRFRRNLLGKRVDYSGRSVIVIGPKLKLHQCGLPKTMALELYRPFVISRLVQYNYTSNVKGAKRIIERERPEVWEMLEEVIKERPVLLNRAPTLHRLGIQAFEPLLVEGKAIQIHPLVCSAFNADFDGDQMAVHVPLSEQAVAEARELMLSTRNLLKPSDGAPIVGPSKDMVLGNYYLTMDPTVEIVALRERADEFRSETVLYEGKHKVGIALRSNGYYYAQFRNVPNSQLYLDETAPDANGRQRVVKSAVDCTVDALLKGEVDCMLANAYEMRKYLRQKGLEDQLEITNLHVRRVVVDMDEVEYLYRIGLVNLHSPILLGNVYDESGAQEEPEICTVGRAIFNRILPDEMRFVQETMGKRGLQNLVARCYQVIGGERTTNVLDAIKNYGFHYATVSGTTLAISDLTFPRIIDERAEILRQADEVVNRAERDYRRGLMTFQERYQITVDEWTRAKEYLQERIEAELDPYGPIAIMAISGATKGGFGPLTQLAGMRGLIADAAGRIIDLPIRSHFREGLDTLEFFMSTHGARKGLADTALRTADAGYLTRRLVDVAQDMIVNRWDCGTMRRLVIHKNDNIAGQSVSERIVGRCSGEDIFDPASGEKIVGRNEMIDEEIAVKIQESDLQALEVRSPLTCDLIHGVCALCYGRDLGTGEMVNIGTAVGIIAAQSIGEPGTQLTLRTFHAAGAVSSEGDITGRPDNENVDGTRAGVKRVVAEAGRGGLPRVTQLFEARKPNKGVEAVMIANGGVLRLSERSDGARIATVTYSDVQNETHVLPDGWEFVVEDKAEVKAGAAIAKMLAPDGIAKEVEKQKQDDLNELKKELEQERKRRLKEVQAENKKQLDEALAKLEEKLAQEREQRLEKERAENETQKGETLAALEEELEQERERRLKSVREKNEERRKEALAALEEELEQEREQRLREVREKIDAEKGEALAKLDEALAQEREVQLEEKREQIEAEKDKALAKLKKELAQEREQELGKLREAATVAKVLVESEAQAKVVSEQAKAVPGDKAMSIDAPVSKVLVAPERGKVVVGSEENVKQLDTEPPAELADAPEQGKVVASAAESAKQLDAEAPAKLADAPEQGKVVASAAESAKRLDTEPSAELLVAPEQGKVLASAAENAKQLDTEAPAELADEPEQGKVVVSAAESAKQLDAEAPAELVDEPEQGKVVVSADESAKQLDARIDKKRVDGSKRIIDKAEDKYIKAAKQLSVQIKEKQAERGKQIFVDFKVQLDEAEKQIHTAIRAKQDDGSKRINQDFEMKLREAEEQIHTDIGAKQDKGSKRINQDFETKLDKAEKQIHTDIGAKQVDGSKRINQDFEKKLRKAEKQVDTDIDKVCAERKKEISERHEMRKSQLINGFDPTKEPIVAGMDGQTHIEDRTVFIRSEYIEEHPPYDIPARARLRRHIHDGMQVPAGEQITEGPLDPHRILKVLGAKATQLYLLSEIQDVYRSQGVNIADKHFETVIRKMMCKVQITKSGDSDLLPGELVDQLRLLEINEKLIAENREPCSGSPMLLGITKAALETDSYLSAASFQHTIKVLAGAAIEGQVDPLHGLKENVIIGKLIPAGTGFEAYPDRELAAADISLEAPSPLDFGETGDLDDFESTLPIEF